MKSPKLLILSVLTLLPAQAMAFAPAKAPADPTPPTPPAPAANYKAQVLDLAAKSSCAKTSWADRGRAPAGYIKGMALSYARSLCRMKMNDGHETPAALMSRAAAGATSTDALAWYESQFADANLSVANPGAETLRSLYTLGIGLGMRESSGEYCTGYDTSAGPETASEAEAGTFQFSYNSIGASSELRKLYDEYQADPSRCLLTEFKEGVSCRAQDIVGSGAGADFQAFAKSCPAFAAEYAMTGMRVIRKHWGPLNRHEAQVVGSCDQLLEDVQHVVEGDTAGACDQLF